LDLLLVGGDLNRLYFYDRLCIKAAALGLDQPAQDQHANKGR